jgi:phosphatidylinositol glycan class W
MTILYLIHYVTASVLRGHANELQQTPRVLHAVNRFGLAVFLLSNILTGLVNLSLDTLHASDGKAMIVLSVYVALVCGSALLLERLPIVN